MKTDNAKDLRRGGYPKKVLKDLINPFLFLRGLCAVSFPFEKAADVLNLCRALGINFRRLCVYDAPDGRRGIFACGLRDFRVLFQKCGDAALLRCEDAGGVPVILKRYKNRPGIFVGIFIMLAIIFVSFGFIWDVRISGNDTVSDLDVIRQLSCAGLSTGKKISSLDVDEIENRLLKASENISWISINLRGTVANVQVREKETAPRSAPKKPSNLVAGESGEIILLEVYSGHTEVKVGDIVNRGDILVSGVYDSVTNGVRLRRSVGSVFARTTQIIEIEVPYKYTEKVYTGKKVTDATLFFFSKPIKFSNNSGKIPISCDKINKSNILTLIRGKNLPLVLESTTYLEYAEKERRRSAEAACEIAFGRLEEKIYSYTKNSQMTGKSISVEIGEEGVRLTCRLTLIRDIAECVEIDYKFD